MITTIIVLIAMFGFRQLLKSFCSYDRYKHEMPKWVTYLGIWRINGGNSKSIDFNWGYWSPSMGFGFETFPSYEENWFSIRVTFIFGTLCFILKWRPSDWDANMDVNEAEKYRAGFGINEDIFYINKPGEAGLGYWKSWRIPFISLIHTGEKVIGDKTTINLIDVDLTSVTVTYWETQTQYRRKWTPITKTFRRINYDYNGKEVGPEKGSWKGGVMSGCASMEKGESLNAKMLKVFDGHKNGK